MCSLDRSNSFKTMQANRDDSTDLSSETESDSATSCSSSGSDDDRSRVDDSSRSFCSSSETFVSESPDTADTINRANPIRVQDHRSEPGASRGGQGFVGSEPSANKDDRHAIVKRETLDDFERFALGGELPQRTRETIATSATISPEINQLHANQTSFQTQNQFPTVDNPSQQHYASALGSGQEYYELSDRNSGSYHYMRNLYDEQSILCHQQQSCRPDNICNNYNPPMDHYCSHQSNGYYYQQDLLYAPPQSQMADGTGAPDYHDAQQHQSGGHYHHLHQAAPTTGHYSCYQDEHNFVIPQLYEQTPQMANLPPSGPQFSQITSQSDQQHQTLVEFCPSDQQVSASDPCGAFEQANQEFLPPPTHESSQEELLDRAIECGQAETAAITPPLTTPIATTKLAWHLCVMETGQPEGGRDYAS